MDKISVENIELVVSIAELALTIQKMFVDEYPVEWRKEEYF
mgnify:CR=1 FL=1